MFTDCWLSPNYTWAQIPLWTEENYYIKCLWRYTVEFPALRIRKCDKIPRALKYNFDVITLYFYKHSMFFQYTMAFPLWLQNWKATEITQWKKGIHPLEFSCKSLRQTTKVTQVYSLQKRQEQLALQSRRLKIINRHTLLAWFHTNILLCLTCHLFSLKIHWEENNHP